MRREEALNMRLSEAARFLPGISIIKDGSFDDLELLATDNGRKVLSFIEKPKYLDELNKNVSIACVLCPPAMLGEIDRSKYDGVATIDKARLAFFTLHHALLANTDFYGSPFPSRIDPSAKVHPTAFVSPENVVIGANTVIGPNVSILSKVEIGDNVVIGAGTVIGGDGFEAFRYEDKVLSVQHAGWARIRDNVEIHCNCCVDRGLFSEDTVIGEYSKLDNLVHIAHNVVLGRRVLVAAAAMFSGRVSVEDDSWIGPGSCLTNGMHIGKGGSISIGAVATRDVADEQTVSGNFAIEHSKFISFIKTIR